MFKNEIYYDFNHLLEYDLFKTPIGKDSREYKAGISLYHEIYSISTWSTLFTRPYGTKTRTWI